MDENQDSSSAIVKVLIIRFSSIGDIVLTTPIVRCLKGQLHGESEIHYVVRKPFAGVLENNPYIDKLHVLDDNTKELIDSLKNEHFHYIIDLHKNIRSHLFRKRLKALTFEIRKLNVQKWILVNFGIDLLPDIHIVDRYFEAVKALGIKNDEKGLDYFIPENEKVNVRDKFSLDSNSYIALAIGGAHEGKKLSPIKLIELCKIVEHSTILLGGEQDADVAEKIAGECPGVINACGKLSLNESASVIEQCRLVISHDSGMMHIGAAFKKKIISIWGATVPKFGMYPYMPHQDSVMIQADHLKFRPTSKLGNKNSKKEKQTTEEIDLNKIKESVEKMWIPDS